MFPTLTSLPQVVSALAALRCKQSSEERASLPNGGNSSDAFFSLVYTERGQPRDVSRSGRNA